MMKNNIEDLVDLAIEGIKKSKNVYIASHVNPDGDNIGSILALGHALSTILPNVFIVKTDEIPSDFLFLPGVDLIGDYNISNDIDLFIALDSSDENRLGKNKDLMLKAKTVINIDHHISNTNFGDINIVVPDASATGELVYKLIKKMNISIDKDIASCIYTAISSDTGSFMYDNTTSETHEIVAELLKAKIDKNEININLYQNRSLERTLLLINALESLEFHNDHKIALVRVTQDMLERTKAKMEDTEGIVSFVKEIAPVEVAILLKEFQPNDIKVSMRSKRYIDVSQICAIFGGGGHIRAAGCTINSSISDAGELIINNLEKAFR